MTAGQKFSYALLLALVRPLSLLPLGFHRGAGRVLAFLTRSVFRYRRDDVMLNLSRAFPEMGIHELKANMKSFYRYFGNLIGEAIWFGGCSNPERLKKAGIVRIVNPEILNALYDKGKSVVVLASHNGNWELFGGYESYGELKVPENDLSVVFRELSSPVWNKFMFCNRITPIVDKKHFDGLQESAEIMRYVYNNRETRKVYFFINDQRPYFESPANMEVEFMHRKTLTMTGAVALAKMFGFSVVYQNMNAKAEGGYEIAYRLLAEDASSCEIKDLIDEYYRCLEEDMRANPWNYLWTHRRWEYYK